MMWVLKPITWILLMLALAGCASQSLFLPYPYQAEKYRQAITLPTEQPGLREDVLAKLAKAQQGSDGLLYSLESGRINQLSNQFEASKHAFNQAIARFEANDLSATIETSGLVEQGAALLVNDNAISYRGAGYERILAHHFQAYNYLGLNDLEGTEVELRKVALEQRVLLEKHEAELAKAYAEAAEEDVDVDRYMGQLGNLDRLIGNLKNSFQNAYTFYFSAVFWEARGDLNRALVDYKKAHELRPEIQFIKDDIDRLENNTRPVSASAKAGKGEGNVVVFFEQGFVPRKHAHPITIPTFDGGVITISIPAYDGQTEEWQISPSLRVMSAQFEDLGQTQTLLDVGGLAVKHFREQLPKILLRQVLRGYAKYQMQKQAADSHGLAGQFVANLYNIISERADLRSWLTLPKSVQVSRFRLPEGQQDLNLSTPTNDTTLSINVEARRTTVVRVVAVNNQLLTHMFNL